MATIFLYGGAGRDIISGGEGADTLDGGDNEDGFQKFDLVDYSGAAASSVSNGVEYGVRVRLQQYDADGNPIAGSGQGKLGDAEGDILIGIEGIRGSAYNDVFLGNAASNEIYGLGGDDRISGGDGIDFIHGGYGDDTISGGAGSDSLNGGDGADRISGGIGSDEIEGGMGDDTIRGDNGNDILDGGDGNDYLHGNSGDDTLRGGAGEDSYYFYSSDSGDTDTIEDSGGLTHISFTNSGGSGYGDPGDFFEPWIFERVDDSLVITTKDDFFGVAIQEVTITDYYDGCAPGSTHNPGYIIYDSDGFELSDTLIPDC